MAETKTTKTTRTRRKKVDTTPVIDNSVAETTPVPPTSGSIIAKDDAGKAIYTEDDVQRMVQEAVKAALANITVGNTVTPSDQSVVSIVFMGKANRNNILQFGRFGSIYGDFGSIDIPKSAFGGEFMTSWVRQMLDERSLVVVDGLTDAERIRFGVYYKDGEVLTVKEYDGLLDMDEETICKRYSEVCEHYRTLIASMIENARVAGDPRVNRDVIEHLNKISQGINARLYGVNDIRRMGAFAHTLREMGINV